MRNFNILLKEWELVWSHSDSVQLKHLNLTINICKIDQKRHLLFTGYAINRPIDVDTMMELKQSLLCKQMCIDMLKSHR